MRPKATVMIPTYNQARWLSEAIESALAQDLDGLEVVVGDDASTDGTPEVIARYAADPRLKVVRQPRNLGRVGNYRSLLYGHATGGWVLNLDGDDTLTDPSYLRTALDEAQRHPRAVLAVGGVCSSHLDGPPRDRLPTEFDWQVVEGADYFLNWKPSTLVPHLACLYRRPLAVSLGFYRSDILFSDGESLRRLVLHGQVLLCGRVVGRWRTHAANASWAVSAALHIANLELIMGPFRHALSRGLDPRRLEAWKKANLREYGVLVVHRCLDQEACGQALLFLRHLWRSHPRAFWEVTAELVLSGRPLVKLLLLALGGRDLLAAARARWHRVKLEAR